MAWLSIAGMYAYDNTIFDNMKVPDGVDKDTLIFNILSETAELEVLYPDVSFMKEMLKMWSAKELPVWERMYKTTKLEYNPIENYDRIEEFTDVNSGHAVSRVAAFNENSLTPSGDGDTDSTSTRNGRIHGNIGVTTSQKMIEEERRVSEFNIADYIIDSFKKRFCLLIY